MQGKGLTLVPVQDLTELEQMVLRALPSLVLVDADSTGAQGLAVCTRLKADPYTAIAPLVAVIGRHVTERVKQWFGAWADEVVTPLFEPS